MKYVFLTIFLVFSLPAHVLAALSVVCHVVVPATDPGTQTGAAARSITPCTGSMLTGDMVFVFVSYFNSTGGTTITNSTTGGQTWTSVAQQDSGSLRSSLFHTIWNGTWAADPAWTNSNLTANSFTIRMMVIRGQHATTQFDVAITSGTASVGADPFPVSVAEVTTTVANALVIVFLAQSSLNAWDNFAAGWTNTTPVQIVNTSGSDNTNGVVYQTKASAGGTGALTFNTDTTQGFTWYKFAVAPAIAVDKQVQPITAN